MRNCRKCNQIIPASIRIDGKRKTISNRRFFCLDCSPLGGRNCKDLSLPPELLSQTMDIDGILNKRCACCSSFKPVDEFYAKTEKRNGPLSVYCKICWSKITIDKQRKRKLEMIEYKGGKCEICGYDKCPAAFDFHHLNSSEKDFNLSSLRNYKLENIKDELDKCILLCANCHRELHYLG